MPASLVTKILIHHLFTAFVSTLIVILDVPILVDAHGWPKIVPILLGAQFIFRILTLVVKL